jgi:hypothetical protein
VLTLLLPQDEVEAAQSFAVFSRGDIGDDGSDMNVIMAKELAKIMQNVASKLSDEEVRGLTTRISLFGLDQVN